MPFETAIHNLQTWLGIRGTGSDRGIQFQLVSLGPLLLPTLPFWDLWVIDYRDIWFLLYQKVVSTMFALMHFQDYPIGWPLLPPSRSKKIEQLVHRVCNSPVAWRIICEGSLKNTKEHAIFELRVLETPKGNLFNLKHFLEAQRKTCWDPCWRFN